MANILDYLAWRGDIPLSASPWNELDSLLISVLSYLNFHGTQDPRGWTLQEAKRIDLLIPDPGSSFPKRKEVFDMMADSRRFGECRMHHQIVLTDHGLTMQFSAMCVDLPDGTMAVAYRGTDNTLVGWREDFNMAYQTRVPGQEAAGYYLRKAARLDERPLRIMGHSKGGNLAVYAAADVPERVQGRIEYIWSFDGPGVNPDMARSEGFGRIKDRIISFIPQTSIIGLLMEYYRPYTVVRSTAKGIEQHDPLTWQVYGRRFEEMESVDRTAAVVQETLRECLTNSTPEQRAAFVETLFRLADSTNATRMSDLLNEKYKSLWRMVGNRKEVDPETRRIFNRLVAQAVTLGFGNVVERVRGRSEQDGPEEWTTMDAGAPVNAAETLPEKPAEKIAEKPAEKSAEKTEEKNSAPKRVLKKVAVRPRRKKAE